MTTENSRADALTDEQLDAAVAAWFRASDHEHLVDQDERFRSRMRSAIAIASPADQPAAAPILKSPEGEDPMRFGDRSLESSIKRLTAAYCMQQPSPIPDQMALVWRFDIGRLRNDWIRLNSWQESKVGEPAPADERAAFEYDDVVSICDAHGIGLPVDCVEMVVEIVKLSGLLTARAASASETEGAEPCAWLVEWTPNVADTVWVQSFVNELDAINKQRQVGGRIIACAPVESLSRSPAMAAVATRYFVHDNDCGYEEFDTDEARHKAHQAAIDGYLDDGWSEEVTSVVSGIVTHITVKTNEERRPQPCVTHPEHDDENCEACIAWNEYPNHEFDTCCSYVPESIAAHPGQPEPRAAGSIPRVHGVSRVHDNPCAVLVMLKAEPTDNELRAIHDCLTCQPEPRDEVADSICVPARVVELLGIIKRDGVLDRASELQEVYRLIDATRA